MRSIFRTRRLLATLACAAILPTHQSAIAAPGPFATHPRGMPYSYSGTLPCADCAGLRYTLNLFDDGAYLLRAEYLGKTPTITRAELGQWRSESDGHAITLLREWRVSVRFAAPSADTLRMLDTEGKPIRSNLNYTLHRDKRFDQVEYRGAMRGTYSVVGDNAIFEECGSGLRLPILAVGDSGDLRSAYARVRGAPDAGVLATLDGRIVGNEESGPRLLVEHAGGLWPGETCGAAAPAALQDTYWRLTRLGDQAVRVADRSREPYISFREGNVSGNSGCNRLVGTYKQEGDALSFGPIAGTRMACISGMEQEQRFLDALGEVAKWRINGSHLELLDATGRSLARFEAAEMR
ncbi:META domain-containing protein [Uliginosibacterium sp. sgz301328]|uniref:META domain-containing protein n=1 Tax=Uliginosibacterium sp. sgz301328 TaxID=3243764 RepID=UPI00359CD36F